MFPHAEAGRAVEGLLARQDKKGIRFEEQAPKKTLRFEQAETWQGKTTATQGDTCPVK